jgi:hypothetical protein
MRAIRSILVAEATIAACRARVSLRRAVRAHIPPVSRIGASLSLLDYSMFAVLLALCVLMVVGAGLCLIAILGMWDKPK